MDIVLQDFSNTGERKLACDLPNRSFTNVNYDKENILVNNWRLIGLLSDMNDDGVVDLIRYSLDVTTQPLRNRKFTMPRSIFRCFGKQEKSRTTLQKLSLSKDSQRILN